MARAYRLMSRKGNRSFHRFPPKANLFAPHLPTLPPPPSPPFFAISFLSFSHTRNAAIQSPNTVTFCAFLCFFRFYLRNICLSHDPPLPSEQPCPASCSRYSTRTSCPPSSDTSWIPPSMPHAWRFEPFVPFVSFPCSFSQLPLVFVLVLLVLLLHFNLTRACPRRWKSATSC